MFIRTNLPEEGGDMEQKIWAITSRLHPSPIFGWPKGEVTDMIKDVNAMRSDASIEDFFPLHMVDLHPDWMSVVLPLVLPFALMSGFIFAGISGRGKTVLARIIGMALARYPTLAPRFFFPRAESSTLSFLG